MIERRDMWMQVLLSVVTLGIYAIYWFYVTSKEMVAYKNLDGSPGLWTVLLFVPVANLYAYWKYSQAVEAVTDQRYSAIFVFLLWVLFSPAVWLITQIELNRLAEQPPKIEPAEEVQPAPTEPTGEEEGGDGDAGGEAP